MSGLDQLEMQRLQLEETVAKLRKSLQHWRTWDAEYEGLKEEISTSADITTETDCARISEQLDGELVNKKEIYELFGVGKGQFKSTAQVSGFIDRRLDYVQQNIGTISKQLQAAEDRLQQIFEEQNQGDDTNSTGLPLTEITEELDEDGNIISTKVSQPENSSAQILDTLRKAGLTELESGSKSPQPVSEKSTTLDNSAEKSGSTPGKTLLENGKQPAVNGTDSGTRESKKVVKFAEDVQVKEFITTSDIRSPANKKLLQKPDPSLVSGSFSSKDRVIELDDGDEIVGATLPEDESPEDARLRREMLQYSLNEVGSVVAELELEEDYSDDEGDEFEFDDDENISEDEQEDQYGRSTRKLVGSKYRQQMLELEEKLMARMIENVGPQPDENNPDIDPEDLRKLVIRQDDEMPSAKAETVSPEVEKSIKQKDPSVKKGVRFSDVLDIQEAPNTKSKQSKSTKSQKKAAPIADNVMERKAPVVEPIAQDEKKPAKVSRFKQNRTSAEPTTNQELLPQPAQNGTNATTIKDEDRPILSNAIVERPATVSSAPPQDPDELDPEIQQRQLASEYYRMRNSMIRQQGGFKMTEEDRERPLMEERDGQVKKVSRFKAARLGQ